MKSLGSYLKGILFEIKVLFKKKKSFEMVQWNYNSFGELLLLQKIVIL